MSNKMMMDNNAIGRSSVGTQFKSVGDNKQQGDDEQKNNVEQLGEDEQQR